MFWKMRFLIPFLLLSGILPAGDWRQKPFMEWAQNDVDEILDSSPWVYTSKTNFPVAGALSVRRVVRGYPMIRLLTAKPVRLAYLRMIALNPGFEREIDVRDLPADRDPKAGEARLQRFIQSNPDYFLLKGDSEFIILSMTMSQVTTYPYPRVAEREEITKPDELAEIHLADLAQTTYMANQKGQRVYITHFDPPGTDNLGARLRFPRKLPDGKPFIAQGDTELRFQTSISGKKLTAKFNLRNLSYEGKLEF